MILNPNFNFAPPTRKPPFGTPINPAHPLARGLVASYLFNEGSGTKAYDSSGNGNHGTLTNMAMTNPTSGWVPGPHGAALAFDGSNDYVNLGDPPLITGLGNSPFSIFAWIKTGYSGGRQEIVTAGSTVVDKGLYLHISHDVGQIGCLKCDLSVGAGNPSAIIVIDGFWHFVGVVNKSGIFTLYIDGQSSGIPKTFSPNISSGAAFIGRSLSPTFFFNGLISSVSIYNRALSAQEIAYLYAFPWCMYEQDLRRGKIYFYSSLILPSQFKSTADSVWKNTADSCWQFLSYSLAANSGALTITGTAIGTKATRKLSVETGSLTLNGTALDLRRGIKLALESGILSMTGSPVTLRAERKLDIASGAATLAGTSVGLTSQRRLGVDSGTLSLTGTAVALLARRIISLASGSATITGTDVSLIRHAKLLLDSGVLKLTGTAVDLIRRFPVDPALIKETDRIATWERATGAVLAPKVRSISAAPKITGV